MMKVIHLHSLKSGRKRKPLKSSSLIPSSTEPFLQPFTQSFSLRSFSLIEAVDWLIPSAFFVSSMCPFFHTLFLPYLVPSILCFFHHVRCFPVDLLSVFFFNFECDCLGWCPWYFSCFNIFGALFAWHFVMLRKANGPEEQSVPMLLTKTKLILPTQARLKLSCLYLKTREVRVESLGGRGDLQPIAIVLQLIDWPPSLFTLWTVSFHWCRRSIVWIRRRRLPWICVFISPDRS